MGMGDTYDGRQRGPSTLHSALDRRSAGVPGDNRPSDQPTLRHEEEGERAIYFIVTTTNRLFTERIWDDDDGMDRQTVGGRVGGQARRRPSCGQLERGKETLSTVRAHTTGEGEMSWKCHVEDMDIQLLGTQSRR